MSKYITTAKAISYSNRYLRAICALVGTRDRKVDFLFIYDSLND